jgi:hypothetical protein
MRNLLLSLLALSALFLVAAVPLALHPEPVVLAAVELPQVAPVTSSEVAAAMVTPVEVEKLSEDPWYAPLRELTETLSDAYYDRPHAGRFGETAGEKPLGRQMRLSAFTDDVLAAVRARAGDLAQFGPDAAWGYAATLIWIAHRETRIASDPSKLGNQDNGRAHGYLQVWSWKNQDPYVMSTALDMLIEEPGPSWSLPKGKPWLGYPECARWLAAHPAP